MKTRAGFVSNSSSSSFIVMAPEESFYNALIKNYEDIFQIDKIETHFNRNLPKSFLLNMKDRWVSDMNDGRFNFTHDNEELEFIDTLEEFEKCDYIPEISDNIKAAFAAGWRAWYLDVPDSGEGGTSLQAATRDSLKSLKLENILIEEIL